MRILYVAGASTLDNPGGIETYGRELMKGMAGRGHVIECLDTAPHAVAADRRVLDYWPSSAFRARYYLRRRFPHEDYRYHMGLRRRAVLARARFRPDVVHALHTYPFGAIVDANEPVVVTAYGLEVEAIPPVEGSISVARFVHAISRFTSSLVKDRVPSAAPVEVLSWGIRPRPPKPSSADFDLITVARLVRRKNVDGVLRALAGLGHLRYAVVGDGPDLATLKDLAASLRLNHVTFFGAVSEDERRDLLARSRLFVMCPRRDRGDVEGLGLVYFEAFEYGLPVVAANSGGVPDAVGDAGILIDDPESTDQLAAAIRSALDERVHEELASRVRTRQRTHSWEAFLDQFEAFYERARTRALTAAPAARRSEESSHGPSRTD